MKKYPRLKVSMQTTLTQQPTRHGLSQLSGRRRIEGLGTRPVVVQGPLGHYGRTSGNSNSNSNFNGMGVNTRAARRNEDARTLSVDLETADAPFLEPFVRSFILGVGAGAMLEGGHVALQVMAGSFPGISHYSPLLVADHVTAFASWICLYTIEAVAILAVLRKFNWDASAAATDIHSLVTLPKRMLPLRTHIFSRLFAAGRAIKAAKDNVFASTRSTLAEGPVVTPQQQPLNGGLGRAEGMGTITPGPRRIPPSPRKDDVERNPQHQKRAKELRDRRGYLKNVWYAAAISEKVGKKPVEVELCGKQMVLWREETTGRVRCIDNACPHRGAPLSGGWIAEREGRSCVVCPYHGWALDGEGTLHDVPAASNKGEWPKRPLLDAYPVEEKGGFVWLFYGSTKLPADARPPIPYTPELDDPSWKPVYEEMEFDCNHFGVFENAIDMAHIHYLHSDSFGNQDAPEIRDMEATADAHSVTATFKIQNKPVNAFWALFKVPAVEVTAKAYLPSTSLVSFTLANGLSFITFVNTVPISANRSINRFALVRRLGWDRTGVFNSRAWDKMARDAMIKILSEDKAMVEKLRYDQLPAEYSVRADLPQVAFRKLRQQWADLVGVVPTEEEQPPYTQSNRDM